ncbi:YL1 nuclear protein-domain-containing protein [Peziza echinospora]|nr:YL1 nuclear protein-domain-containing protein [Peziza echinospora]
MPKRTRRKSSTRTTSTTPPSPTPVSGDGKASPAAPLVVESLVAGREKRSTAGNRLAHLLDREAANTHNADDDLELLFQEEEDDVEFEAVEEDGWLSDVQLESSDEEEDQGTAAYGDGNEDLAGENELQAEVRAEKSAAAKKRKAPETFFKQPRPSAARKRVTLETGDDDDASLNGSLTPSEAALNKQRKKSERISWIPTEGPTRSSSRKLSLHNRAVTHQRLKESEARRLHTIALMEAAAKKKQKENPKREMTQAERLEEAKMTEEMNRKSLNTWEESEAIRAEQQRIRLAALHNRHLQGAVIKWWSGRAEWDANGKLIKVGKVEKVAVKDGDKEKVKETEVEKKGKPKAKAPVKEQLEGPTKDSGQTTEDEVDVPMSGSGSSSHTPPVTVVSQASPTPVSVRPIPSIVEIPADATPQPSEPISPPVLPPTFTPKPGVPPQLLDGILYYASLPNETKPDPAPPCIKTEYSSRNLIILQSFEPSQVQNKESLSRTLFPHNSARREKPTQAVCYMTSELARFRDPHTNIPYANLWAYKQIQKIRSGQVRWSSLLEAYVGPAEEAAKGVPEGFL